MGLTEKLDDINESIDTRLERLYQDATASSGTRRYALLSASGMLDTLLATPYQSGEHHRGNIARGGVLSSDYTAYYLGYVGSVLAEVVVGAYPLAWFHFGSFVAGTVNESREPFEGKRFTVGRNFSSPLGWLRAGYMNRGKIAEFVGEKLGQDEGKDTPAPDA